MSIKTFVVAAIAAAALASPAAAATLVQNQNVATLGAGTSSLVSFDQFDASLGTLDSVTLDFTYFLTDVSATVRNTGKKSREFTVESTSSAGLTGNGFALSALGTPMIKTITLAAGATGSLGPFNANGAGSATLTEALAAFIGGGDLAFNFSRAASFHLIPEGQGTITAAPMLGGTAALTYNYTLPPPPPPVGPASVAVPEPASWALMITGFGGVGAMMRRRRLVAVAA